MDKNKQMTNLENPISLPLNCVSYYASSKSHIDNKHAFCYWMRGKFIRILNDKPFARGDCLTITSIEDSPAGLVINTELLETWKEEYPVLLFISGRLIYNKWVQFEYMPTSGIKIIQPIEQILSENYSLGFVVLATETGKISCVDKVTDNCFDVFINLEWE